MCYDFDVSPVNFSETINVSCFIVGCIIRVKFALKVLSAVVSETLTISVKLAWHISRSLRVVLFLTLVSGTALVSSGTTGTCCLGFFSGVLFDGLEDGFWDWGWCWEVVTAGTETVFVGDVVDGVGGAVVTLVGVAALDYAGFLFAAGVLQFSGFLLAYAVFGFVAGSKRILAFLEVV